VVVVDRFSFYFTAKAGFFQHKLMGGPQVSSLIRRKTGFHQLGIFGVIPCFFVYRKISRFE